jgi:6-pyruvoyltetrahydropterin/6-carboxytetrahydropterin synthase
VPTVGVIHGRVPVFRAFHRIFWAAVYLFSGASFPASTTRTRTLVMQIFKVFQLEAAHLLPNVPAGHKCARLHGHSFRIEIHVEGEPDPKLGWVMDFADLKTAFAPLYDQLDHHYLNDIEGLENPTSEMLSRWIFTRLAPRLVGLDKVVVHETCTSGASCTRSSF